MATAVFVLLAVWLFWPVLRCAPGCGVDLAAVHGQQLGGFEIVDVRLNVWILGWVQHALGSAPLDLFAANAFYPSTSALAGSEHILGMAVLTWPLRLVTTDAVLIYNLTIALSFVIMGATTFALVRWLTGSRWASLAAGAVAMLMPWRLAELTHIQLLGAHWFPLIWLLVLRIGTGEAHRRDRAALAVVLTLQLLTSYYLAYMLTVSLAALGVAMLARRTTDGRTLGGLALAAMPAYAALVALSLPYLQRGARGELAMPQAPELVTSVADLGRLMAFFGPGLEASWSPSPAAMATYYTPAVVLLLTVVTLVLGARAGGDGQDRRQRVALTGLWLCVAAAVVLAMGSRLRLGESTVPLPAQLASSWLPGFSNLRAPHRWTMLVAIALPVLAGVGAARLDAAASAAGGRVRLALVAGVVAALALTMPARPLPGASLWDDQLTDGDAYAALTELPEGPVVEIPWRVHPVGRLLADSNYLLASTLHWRPILNGITAYPPGSYTLVNHAASGLPAAASVARLRKLVDVRWVVVHVAADPALRATWLDAAAHSGLRPVYSDERALIFEFPDDHDAGAWMDDMVSPLPRDRTLTGVPRVPVANAAGELAAGLPERVVSLLAARLDLTITNDGELAWPGLDHQREGLLHARYVFSDADGVTAAADLVPLYEDVPAGETASASIWIRPPPDADRYTLCVDLVQPYGGEVHPLPLDPVSLHVNVEPRPGQGAGGRENLTERLARSVSLDGWTSRCVAPPASVAR